MDPRHLVLTGDCRVVLADHRPFDLLIVDPPYGDTALGWDRRVEGWERTAADLVKPNGSLWLFGSLRSLMASAPALAASGWRLVQDIVWEKHTGSGFQNDRFRRVHEHICHYVRADARWRDVYNAVQVTHDAKRRVVRRRTGPPHAGAIGESVYATSDGGPRLARSVVQMRSMHRRAIHPTEKPVALLQMLVRTSCPTEGRVGDLFAGSGAAGEAAIMEGRAYVGAELDPTMAELARCRLDCLLPFNAFTAA